MEKLTTCPACGHENFIAVMRCKDFTVSNTEFDIVSCGGCGLEFTNPRPSQRDIGFYYASADYVSHSDEKAPGLINAIYRKVRTITLAQKEKLVGSFFAKPGRLLDIGCGTGAFAGYMQKAGWRVEAVEPDEGAAQKARDNHKLTVQEENWLTNTQNYYDVITMWHVLEHVHDLSARFTQLWRLASVGGYVVIAVPNPESVDSQHYGSLWAARDVPRHLYHFPPEMLRKRMESEGFEVVKTVGMPFDPFYISMLSERYKAGKDRVILAFVKGMFFWFRSVLSKDKWSSQIYIFRKPA